MRSPSRVPPPVLLNVQSPPVMLWPEASLDAAAVERAFAATDPYATPRARGAGFTVELAEDAYVWRFHRVGGGISDGWGVAGAIAVAVC